MDNVFAVHVSNVHHVGVFIGVGTLVLRGEWYMFFGAFWGCRVLGFLCVCVTVMMMGSWCVYGAIRFVVTVSDG